MLRGNLWRQIASRRRLGAPHLGGDMIDQGGVKGAPGSFQAAIVYWVAPDNAFNSDFAQEATMKGGILQGAI